MSYETKFADFVRLCREQQGQVVIIAAPQVLGDTYEELVESLNRIADAEIKLNIVPRSERKQH
jgi:protein required for attachment to host cells